MSKNKLISYLSSGLFIAGAATGIYALMEVYISRSRLPPGTCPVSENRVLLYIAMILNGISFILSIFEHDNRESKNN